MKASRVKKPKLYSSAVTPTVSSPRWRRAFRGALSGVGWGRSAEAGRVIHVASSATNIRALTPKNG